MAIRSLTRALWVLPIVAACGAFGEEGTANRGEPGTDGSSAVQAVRACDLVDLASAGRIIGPDAEHPGGDMEEWTCVYSSPGVALLTVQLAPAVSYDEVTILQPHSALDVGERGRYNRQEDGPVAVQFVSGEWSVTMGVRPMGVPDVDYFDPLVAAARDVAGQLR